jgi:hypothetical protein
MVNDIIKKECRFCKKNIKEDAMVCHHCGREQNKILYQINKFNYLASLIALALLIVSVSQCSETRKDRVDAIDALRVADSVKIITLELFADVERLKLELDSTIIYFEDITLITTQNAWIHANIPIFGFDVNRPSVKQFEKNTWDIIDKVFKDSIQLKNWWNETDSLIHPDNYK